jgi:cysteine desulfurase / selenocysteine lyase
MAKPVIYLDHAATSWPKPPAVIHAMIAAMADAGGNPGRSGHALSLHASEVIHDCRESLAELFAVTDPLRIAFTANATEALNLAIKGVLQPGDHVVFTSMEHNAVWRPLKALEARGVSLTMVQAGPDGIVAPSAMAQALQPNTKLVVVTHASNVNGAINDIATIGKLVRAHGALFLVDAAQTAGCLPIAVETMAIDLLAFPGHKGLFGPQGTGGLYIRPGLLLAPLREGGTGSLSHLSTMPEIAPDRYESGTPNTPGLAGLQAGVEQVLTEGIASLRARERQLVDQLWDGLAAFPGVTLHGPADSTLRTGIVALTVAGRDCEELAGILDQDFSIACRAGLSCAPLAHATLGTEVTGVLRLSLGASTTANDVEAVLTAFRVLLR